MTFLVFLFLVISFSVPTSSDRCPDNWISAKFHFRNTTDFKPKKHRWQVKLSLKVRATPEKNLEVCGRVYTDEYYNSRIPPFKFFFREEGNRANGFFESSEIVVVDEVVKVGKSFSFHAVLNSTESNSFQNLPKRIGVRTLDERVFFIQDYFYVSSAFFAEFFLSKSKKILDSTIPLKKICIPIYGTSGHGKNAIASHFTSITTPLSRMLHPSGAGKGIDQTTNRTYPQFIVDDKVQILQTVGFEESMSGGDSETSNEGGFQGCSVIERFVNDTIQGELSDEFNCYPFVALYIISAPEANDNVYQAHYCTVKYITGILNSVHKHHISTYTLFNTKGRELTKREEDTEYSKLLFKPPELNVFWLDLNMDSVERDFEKDIILMTLLEDILVTHELNFLARKKVANDELRSNKILSSRDLMILNMNVGQFILQIIWQNLTFRGIRKIWNFLIVFVIPHIIRRYFFEFVRSFSPAFVDFCYGLFGGFSSQTISVFLGYGGFGLVIYFITSKLCCDRLKLNPFRRSGEDDDDDELTRRRQSSIPPEYTDRARF